MTEKIYLVAGKRTPFGKFGGSLKNVAPVDLAVMASKSLLESISLSPDKLDHAILGNVTQSTTDTIYGGRHLILKVGAPISTPGYTVNRLCGSGIQAIVDAMRLIKLGEARCVLASGAENMSITPHLVYGSRFGTKYGALKTVDMLWDTLTDQYTNTSMGVTAENLAKKYSISREECEEFACSSHHKANQAYEKQLLSKEIASVPIKKGELSRDEHLRGDVTIEEMQKLKPSFSSDGTVTAATASGIVDGAASVIIASDSFCEEEGLTPLAEIVDSTVVGVEPTEMGIGPAPAIGALLERNNYQLSDIDLVEINEAFAAQALACAKDLGLDQAKLNIWGGAIALGHPLAASGVRITLTLSHQLRETQSKLGIASACIGGGQGIAILLRNSF